METPKELKKGRKKESLYTETETDSYSEFLRKEFTRLIETNSPKKQTIQNIKKRLKTIPVENLYAAISKYSDSCEGQTYKMYCSNFFGEKETYLDFLPNTDDPEISKSLVLLKTKIDEELDK